MHYFDLLSYIYTYIIVFIYVNCFSLLCSGIRDVMSHSFGEGYATRSDEEGFGGIYGGNQFFPNKDDKDKDINENHPGD